MSEREATAGVEFGRIVRLRQKTTAMAFQKTPRQAIRIGWLGAPLGVLPIGADSTATGSPVWSWITNHGAYR